MPPLREVAKRALPGPILKALSKAREKLAPAPLEDIVLHDYFLIPDDRASPRFTLVIPGISPKVAFGGVTTGIEIFLEIGKRTGADIRILLDDFDRELDTSVVGKCARNVGVGMDRIEIVPRRGSIPQVQVRANDVFCTYNWWTTLNIQPLLQQQSDLFGGERKPFLYIIQEYEPLFYRMSSTYMMARAAFDPKWPCWGLFNSGELYDYFRSQGHKVERVCRVRAQAIKKYETVYRWRATCEENPNFGLWAAISSAQLLSCYREGVAAVGPKISRIFHVAGHFSRSAASTNCSGVRPRDEVCRQTHARGLCQAASHLSSGSFADGFTAPELPSA